MDKTLHQIRCERWLKIVNECLASGMKKSEWCKANGISEKTFYYGQRILRNEAYIDAVAPKQIPAILPTSGPQEVSFVEIKTPAFPKPAALNFQPAVIIRQGSMTLGWKVVRKLDLLGVLRDIGKEH